MFGLITAMLSLTVSSLMTMNLIQASKSSTKSASKDSTKNLVNSEFDTAYSKAKDVPGAEVSVTEPYTYQDGFKTKTGYITKEDEVM